MNEFPSVSRILKNKEKARTDGKHIEFRDDVDQKFVYIVDKDEEEANWLRVEWILLFAFSLPQNPPYL
jgi:hypothetical protein